LGLLLLTLGTGCHLGQPGSASFASVVIKQHSIADIRAATTQVFQADGYKTYTNGSGQLVFQKEGSRANTLSRDGLVAAEDGAVTMIRVRVDMVQLDAGSHRLQCQAFMVSGAGDSFMEDEHRLANSRSGPYQELLDKVASRLK
jgi:hypothetical protein